MVDIGIRCEIEVDEHAHQAVVGVDRIHVIHVVHAAHLLLDGGGYGLLDRLGVGTYVIGLDENLGWDNFGKLGNGQTKQGHQANDHHDDRDHHSDNWTVDE